jgi:hypothetical protein
MRGLLLRGLLAAAVWLVLVTTGGAAPGLLLWSPTTTVGRFDYSTVDPGSTVSHTFTLTNVSEKVSGALEVRVAGVSAFAIGSDGCTGASLGAGESCQVTVAYAPASAGENDAAKLNAGAGGAGIELTARGS